MSCNYHPRLANIINRFAVYVEWCFPEWGYCSRLDDVSSKRNIQIDIESVGGDLDIWLVTDLKPGKNLSILMTLTRSLGDSKTRSSSSGVKSNMINILMELRKWVSSTSSWQPWFLKSPSRCIQHPYLVSNDIEPKNLSERESHERLVAASAKLRLLRTLLPKLKARGHRVLLFSQVSEPCLGPVLPGLLSSSHSSS